MSDKPLLLPILFLSIVAGSACGYLDEEIWLEDEQFTQGLEGSGLGGVGHGWGCGGSAHFGERRVRRPRRSLGALGQIHFDPFFIYGQGVPAESAASTGAAGALTDEEILASTNIEAIEEDVVAGAVEQVYYEVKAERDAAVSTHYTSASD